MERPVNVGVASVGEVPKTSAPVPVSPVTAFGKFDDEGVPRKVAMFAASPETPEEIGSEVASVKSKAGVASEAPKDSEIPPYEMDELVRPELSSVPVMVGVFVSVSPEPTV